MGKRDRLPREEYDLLVQEVFKRDRHRCQVCRLRAMLTAHHVIFRSQGGKDELNNLLVLCEDCHMQGVHKSKIHIHFDNETNKFIIEISAGWKPKHTVR